MPCATNSKCESLDVAALVMSSFTGPHPLPVLPVEAACNRMRNGDQVNKMKHPILTFAAISFSLGMVLGSGAAAAAQDLGNLGQQAQNLGGMSSMSGLAQKLHLSPQQFQQVMPILQGEFPKLQSIMGKTGLTNTQKLDQTKAVQKQSDSKLKSILSPEQFTSLKSFRSLQQQQVVQGVLPH